MAKHIDGFEQSQREEMDQMMKRTQELSDEKTAHEKLKQQLSNCIGHLEETESCMKRVEAASLEEIKALRQLISHNKNVERAVAMNQQCLVQQKKVEATEMQEWKDRIAELAKSHDKLEVLSLKLQNKMLMAQNRQLRNVKGKKMSKTQKAAEEDQIWKLEDYVKDQLCQLNQKKREIVAKISRCNMFLEESHCSQEFDQKLADSKTTKLSVMNEEEKQQIMTKKISIHTELQKAMDVSQQLRTERTEESKKELNPESEQQISNELEAKFEDMDDLLWLGTRKLQQAIKDFKKSITEKAEDEANKRDAEVKKLQQDQERSEKIIKELKEIMKKISTHGKAPASF